jgi:rhodanese-related sulfurtransferase/quinol monooxygenase YgiN
MKKILTCLFSALGLTTACGQQNFENMEVKEFAELITDSNVVILDVRKTDEFAEGHIKGAILIDQFQSDFVEQAKAKLPKEKTIAIYCRSGRRSANAAGKLADVGYKCVNLKGGILAWKESNMPVITSAQEMSGLIVRIAEIEVHPQYLKEYLEAARNVGAESVKKELGVICIFPNQMTEDENKIRIVEIYRNKEAYEHHLTTEHFQTYKQGTLHMVKSLNLVDLSPLDKEAMPLIFTKIQ